MARNGREAAKNLTSPGRSALGWVLAGVGPPFAAVLADFMAVSVALPVLQSATGASFSQLIWVLEAYVLSVGTFLLTSGFVMASIGPARAFGVGSLAFAAGAGAAGAAPGVGALIVARAVQGAGAALVVSAGPLILTLAFGQESATAADGPWAAVPQARPKARLRPARLGFVVWPALTALSVGLAPLAGGLVTAGIGWRYLFYIEAAMGVAGALTFGLGTRGSEKPHRAKAAAGRPDWAGLSLFAGAAASAVIGLVRTTYNLESFASSGVFACLTCSGLLLVAFVAKETVATPPALPVALFAKRSVAGAAASAFGLSLAITGPFPLLCLYLARDLGYGDLGAGLHLLAVSGMALPGVALGGVAARLAPGRQPSPRWALAGGLALVAAGMWLLSRVGLASAWAVPCLLVAGSGYEMASPRLAAAAAAGLTAQQAPAAARSTSLVRQFGGALGLAICASVFAARITSSMGQQLGASARLSGEPPVLAAYVLRGDVPQAVRQAGAGVVKAALAAGLHDALLLSALVAACCALVALFARAQD